VKRIRFIKKAQALGFTLEDVAGLLQLNDPSACAKTRDLAARKLALIERKISELANMRDALSKLVGRCDRKLWSGVCPIIEILQWDSEPSQGRDVS
jgi:MerR family transcriptional regulator, mercuric resistance operon regulatory protein